MIQKRLTTLEQGDRFAYGDRVVRVLAPAWSESKQLLLPIQWGDTGAKDRLKFPCDHKVEVLPC